MDALIGAAPISTERLLLSPFRPPIQSLRLAVPFSPNSRAPRLSRIRASSNSNPNPVVKSIKSAAAGALLLTAATAGLLSGRLCPPPARADPSPISTEEKIEESKMETETKADCIEMSSETVNALRSLVYQKLEVGEDSEALAILNRLILAQPSELEWKFLAARLLNEMGETRESRKLYEEILSIDPLSFEALFENAVLMDRCGDGDAVIERLERALEIASSEQNEKSARDVRFIIAQIKFLQKNVDEALKSYDELAKEDPKDYRPYFCQGVIYSLLDRNKEAREKFAKYKELSPKKFEVDAFLQSPLSRVKLYGTEDSEI